MGLLTTVGLLLLAQSPAFEVASVKPTNSANMGYEGSARFDVRTVPGSLMVRHSSLADCIEWAYGVQGQQVSGPAWLGTERYEIAAKAAEHVPPQQLKLMLQALLAERFHMALHRETRNMQVFEIVAAKGGVKLRAAQSDEDGGVRKVGPGLVMSFENQPVAELAKFLSSLAAVDRPVLDRTGLTGHYDIMLDLRGVLGPDTTDLVVAALREQLGLRMESRKAPVEVLVIDHVNKTPSEN
jgi:uncharacterized protein (TIGR03435 family)